MRTITDHQVPGANETLNITVLDEPGQGGAHHEYVIHEGDARSPSTGVTTPINFQNGPIKEFGVNGISGDALLAIVIDRLRCFQAGPFASQDNKDALHLIEAGLFFLQKRTRDRLGRGVEGTNVK